MVGEHGVSVRAACRTVGLSFKPLRRLGYRWNHKRVRRVHKALGSNLPRRAKKRLRARVKRPLEVGERPNQCWSADFMSDMLYSRRRFRVFTLIDGGRSA